MFYSFPLLCSALQSSTFCAWCNYTEASVLRHSDVSCLLNHLRSSKFNSILQILKNQFWSALHHLLEKVISFCVDQLLQCVLSVQSFNAVSDKSQFSRKCLKLMKLTQSCDRDQTELQRKVNRKRYFWTLHKDWNAPKVNQWSKENRVNSSLSVLQGKSVPPYTSRVFLFCKILEV